MRINKIYQNYGYFVSITFVAIATAIFHLGKSYLDKGQWALIYLLVVLIVASISGTRPAILTAAASFLAWNYFFIPPYNTFIVNDPKDWLFLLTFLIVATIVGLQAGRLKQRETLALAREHEANLLKDFLLTALAYQSSVLQERKKLQQVEISTKAREQSDKYKSIIISSIHHELKTPLSSINATVTNLLEKDSKPSSDVVREELEAIKKDLNRLNSSIGSLVDLSRLETADWEPKKDWYEFGEILGNTLSRISAKERKRILVEDISENREINVDFIQISRVLQIIIENALAYSGKDKSVKIKAPLVQQNIKISIEDNGPGIDNIDKEHIFDKFYRGKTANSPGTGLGLAIAREITNFHGGNIAVKDASPQGSCFVITLPAKKRNYWE